MKAENRPGAVRAELLPLAEPQYQKFAASLIPGCGNLIGVRIPALRKIAVRIAGDAPVFYLENAGEQFFEEIMLKGLIIGHMKEDIEVILEQTALFIPKITNWSLCDSFCAELKIVKLYRERVWKFLKPYRQSGRPYEIRTAVVFCLLYYIGTDYLNKLFALFNRIHSEDYYVKMSVAWAISLCFVKFPVETRHFLKNNRLDDETYNKALQKICESLRVDAETKKAIRSMKRKMR